MRIALNWLLNHLEIHENNKLELIDKSLNKIGIEVDSIELFDLLIVGKVLSVELIPKSSLYKCVVQIKPLFNLQTEFIILTKLNDVKVGMYTSFVPYNNKTPEGFLIEKRTMMGLESQGMFYTTTNNAMIYEQESILNIDAELKLSIGTNRKDLQCVRGIARDLSSVIGKLKPLNYNTQYNNIENIMTKLNIKNINDFVNLDIGISQYYGHMEIQGYRESLQINDKIEYNDIYSENTNIEIFLSHALFYQMSHINISLQQIQEILNKVSFKSEIIRKKPNNDSVHDEFGIQVQAPIWRKDVENEMCIIQEIIRIHGIISHNTKQTYIPYTKMANKNDYLKHVLLSQGFTEMYNIPFETQTLWNNPLQINNTNTYMRNTLLYSLLQSGINVLSYNEINAKLFEIGKVYDIYGEYECIGILIMGYEPANILNQKYELNEKHLQNILNILNMDIILCNDKLCHQKILNNDKNIYGCYCNFILTDSIKLGNNNYTYYYFESNLKTHKYKNTFTNSMEKKYSNINLYSNNTIEWSLIYNIISSYTHRLVSQGFFRDKHRMTINITYNDKQEYDNIIKNLQSISNVYIA